MNLIQAINDPKLFGPWFGDRKTWAAWFAFIAALFAHQMDDEQLALYRQCTRRSAVPQAPFHEAWLVCGRRGGKSFIMALVAVFVACFRSYAIYLQAGERATVLVIAADRKQARVILRYMRGMLTRIPMLARMLVREKAESFDLNDDVTIEVATASFRTVRGYTICAALCDELAFWRAEDSANPDYAVLDALRPAMATIPTALLLCASSPYARRGALWDTWQRSYGKDDASALVWQAPTRTMNPTVPQAIVDREMERDPASAAAEYMAEFRSDVEGFLTREAVAACIEAGVRERPPSRQHRYVGFVDPSGGVSDAFTLAIAHREGERGAETAILDVVREVKPPFSPEAVVSEFVETLKRYRVSRVVGDRFGGEWPREQFRKAGVDYLPSERNRSELYLALLPQIMSRSCDLLDTPVLVNQLVTLERHTGRGRDIIDHRVGGHDDVANSVAGALFHALKLPATTQFSGKPLPQPEMADPLAAYRPGSRGAIHLQPTIVTGAEWRRH